jgi:DNA-binding response OmpR family regulator/Tfp pilus assembly protein PilZ
MRLASVHGVTVATQREPRIVVACPIQLSWQGATIEAISQDISKNGVFIRTEQTMPIGEELDLTLHLPNDAVVVVSSRVVHVLSEAAANALGRLPGMGFVFVETSTERRALLDAYLDELVMAFSLRPGSEPRARHILIADSSTRLLERLSTALGNAGFVVTTAANGAEAYAACLHDPPDLVLAACEMPVVDAWRLVTMMGAVPGLAQIPVALMSEDSGDITRLRAYRLGVMDFIPKPFTVAEVCIRMRRLARARVGSPDRVVLRGAVGEISVATLLSMLEFERKTGILTLTHETDVAWLSVDVGRIVKVEAAADGTADSRSTLMRVLDWDMGEFEFSACEVYEQDELGHTTTQLLIAHAQLRDEEKRAARN